MIVGTGVDLAEVDRIRKSIERYGARFVERIFTSGEIAYVEKKASRPHDGTDRWSRRG